MGSSAREVAETHHRPEPDCHPAFDDPHVKPLPAGKGLLIIAIALVFGLVFNSAGVLHMTLGMPEGMARSIALTAVRPINTVARAVWLDRPKQALDRMFGHDSDATGGADLADGDDSILHSQGLESGAKLAEAPTEPNIVSPTTTDPLRILILGDSLSTFVGQQVDEMSKNRRLVKVRQVYKDGTGINTPDFFNWDAGARTEVKRARAQAVIMVIGGNDGRAMTHNGVELAPNTDEWEAEYGRRVAVIMQSAIDVGAQRIYWSGPPVARNSNWDNSYRRINAAVARAAAAIPGARYVDLYSPSGVDTVYSDYDTVEGKQIRARQGDGIHWTYDGSREPAELIMGQFAKEYGSLL